MQDLCVQNYQGNNREVVNASTNAIEQINHYYSYGGLMGVISTKPNTQNFKYGGKELDLSNGLNLYDFEARQYDSGAPDFTSVDPCATDYPHLSPYNYCAGDPINCIDPTGCSTRVVLNNSTGYYDVIGGDLEDGDRNIYIYAYDEEGNAVNTGIVLGRTPVMTSFYDSDAKEGEKKWRGSINVEDQSGINFFCKVYDESHDSRFDQFSFLFYYMENAKNSNVESYQVYDFKVTNGLEYNPNGPNNEPGDLDCYRGMPIGYGSDKVRIFASARDVGNIVAGVVARRSGLPWKVARLGFDGYQGGIEGISSQNAQHWGYRFAGSKYYQNYFNGRK